MYIYIYYKCVQLRVLLRSAFHGGIAREREGSERREGKSVGTLQLMVYRQLFVQNVACVCAGNR